jgi:hypothetical protein
MRHSFPGVQEWALFTRAPEKILSELVLPVNRKPYLVSVAEEEICKRKDKIASSKTPRNDGVR